MMYRPREVHTPGSRRSWRRGTPKISQLRAVRRRVLYPTRSPVAIGSSNSGAQAAKNGPSSIRDRFAIESTIRRRLIPTRTAVRDLVSIENSDARISRSFRFRSLGIAEVVMMMLINSMYR
jgi:hypothetical protein